VASAPTIFKNLLPWYQKSKRNLPWRHTPDPYKIWISEIMLQQTQVKTVIPYYLNWIKKFPDLKTLAKSSESKVLKAWEGLGYYSRARNIHDSAKQILEKHNGKFPKTFEDILELKGIGRYTAGAIASIAYDQRKPILDGNVERVLSRVFWIKGLIKTKKNQNKLWELAEEILPDKNRGDFTMDSYALSTVDDRAVRNLVHCSDEAGEAKREIDLWLNKEELIDYRLVAEAILYDVNLDGILE
jgi:A/G-specific adenine glycosylase